MSTFQRQFERVSVFACTLADAHSAVFLDCCGCFAVVTDLRWIESFPRRINRKCTLPFFEASLELRFWSFQDFFQFTDVCFELVAFTFLRLGEEFHNGRFIHSISIFRIVQEGHELEIFLLGNRVVLMCVALGARHRSAHPNRHCGVHPVYDRRIPKFLVIGPALVIRHCISVKGGADELLFSGIFQ